MAPPIEQILDRVQLVDPAASSDRAVVVVMTELSAAPKRRRRRRLFGLLISLGTGGLIAVSPAGPAIADFFTGANDAPELSPQDRALTTIACRELGAGAATTSWCTEDEAGGGADAEALLEQRGYKIDRVGPAMAIKSPDGTVLITGTDGLGPEDLPEDFGHRFNQLPDQ